MNDDTPQPDVHPPGEKAPLPETASAGERGARIIDRMRAFKHLMSCTTELMTKVKRGAARIAELTHLGNKHRVRLSRAMAAVRILREQNRHLQVTVARQRELIKKTKCARERFKDLRRENYRMASELRASRRLIEELTHTVEAKSRRVEELGGERRELDGRRDALAALKRENRRLVARLVRIKEQLEATRDKDAEVEDLQNRYAFLQTKYRMAQDNIRSLTLKLEAVSGEHEKLMKQFESAFLEYGEDELDVLGSYKPQ